MKDFISYSYGTVLTAVSQYVLQKIYIKITTIAESLESAFVTAEKKTVADKTLI